MQCQRGCRQITTRTASRLDTRCPKHKRHRRSHRRRQRHRHDRHSPPRRRETDALETPPVETAAHTPGPKTRATRTPGPSASGPHYSTMIMNHHIKQRNTRCVIKPSETILPSRDLQGFTAARRDVVSDQPPAMTPLLGHNCPCTTGLRGGMSVPPIRTESIHPLRVLNQRHASLVPDLLRRGCGEG